MGERLLKIKLKWLLVVVALFCVLFAIYGQSISKWIARQNSHHFATSKVDHVAIRDAGRELIENVIQSDPTLSILIVSEEHWPEEIAKTNPFRIWMTQARGRNGAVVATNLIMEFGPYGETRLIVSRKGHRPLFGEAIIEGLAIE